MKKGFFWVCLWERVQKGTDMSPHRHALLCKVHYGGKILARAAAGDAGCVARPETHN